MNREKIENVLMEMCMPCGIKGFKYIVDAVEYIDEHGENIGVTKQLYPDIAEENNTTSSSVERAIRHAFKTVRGKEEKHDVVEKYIGFENCSNFSSLVMLYKKINLERKTLEHTDEFAEKIREIVRKELSLVLNGLKDVAK